MPVQVRGISNVAVWHVHGSVTVEELKRGFADTNPIREAHPGRCRLLLLWLGDVPAAIREEITSMHDKTAHLFERIVVHGSAMVQTTMNVRVAMARNIGPGMESSFTIDQALARAGEGLPVETQSALRRCVLDLVNPSPPTSRRS